MVGVEGGGRLEGAEVHDGEALALLVRLQEVDSAVLGELGGADLADAHVHVWVHGELFGHGSSSGFGAEYPLKLWVWYIWDLVACLFTGLRVSTNNQCLIIGVFSYTRVALVLTLCWNDG